jgi:hypothetical protein
VSDSPSISDRLVNVVCAAWQRRPSLKVAAM